MALDLPPQGGDNGTWGPKISGALLALDARTARALLPRLGDVDTLVAVGAAEATTWDTYDGSDVIVHPSVRYLPDPLAGARWWAVATPYPSANADYENPSIFTSDDGLTWAPPGGVTNPLVAQPAGDSGQNSDPNLIVGPDGRLHIVYRTEIYSGGTERLSVISSSDGLTWSTPTTILSSTSASRALVSPSVWWDAAAGEWVMLVVDFVPDPRVIRRFTTGILNGTWTEDGSTVDVPRGWPSSTSPWHLEAVMVGSQLVALVQNAASDGDGGDLWLMTSDDGGRTFTRAADPLLRGARYKGSLVPTVTESGVGLMVWAGHHGDDWGATRYAVTRRPPEDTLGPVLAVAAIPPYIAGDAFARADSTSIGTTPTGHAWTADAGQFDIDGNAATPHSSTNNKASIDVGVADFEVSTHLHAVSGSTSCWLTARIADGTTFLRFGFNYGYIQFQRVAGGATSLYSIASSQTDGVFTIRCDGDQVTALLDGVVVWSGTESSGDTATKVGMQADDPGTTYGYIAVRTV